MWLFIVLFLLFFACLSIRDIYKALNLLIFLLPCYLIRFSFIGIPLTLLEMMILILFGAWLVLLKIKNEKFESLREYFYFLLFYFFSFKNKKFKKNVANVQFANSRIKKILPLILLVILASFLGFFTAPDLIKAAGVWKAYFVEPMLFLIVLVSIIKTDEHIRGIIRSLGWLLLAISFYAIIQSIFGIDLETVILPGEKYYRVTSIFEYPNAVGLLLAPIIMVYFIQGIHEISRKSRNLYALIFSFFVIVFGIAAIILARTEAALVALAATTVIIGFLRKNTRLAATLAVLSFIVIITAGNTWQERVTNKIFLRDFSGQIRMRMYSETWQMLKNNIIFGAGLSGYQEAMIPYHKDIIWIGKTLQPVEIFMYPHNIVFNFWSETGILGIIGFLLLFIYFFKLFFRNYNMNFGLALGGAMLVIIIHGIVDVPYFKNDLSVLFWLIFGLMFVYDGFDKQVLKEYNKIR